MIILQLECDSETFIYFDTFENRAKMSPGTTFWFHLVRKVGGNLCTVKLLGFSFHAPFPNRISTLL